VTRAVTVPDARGGEPAASVEHTVEDRWLRAYAAAVGDLSGPLFDLERPGGIVAHPVFPVCIEWPLVAEGPPGLGLDSEAIRAGLHVSHEILWHRPIRPGDSLRTAMTVDSLEERSVGVFAVFELTTVGAGGEPVVDSREGVLYRGSTLGEAADPGPRQARDARAAPPPTLVEVGDFRVEEADAVIYTECARIWNPIHTDPRAARLAGLSAPVLHGTATLARTMSALLETRLGGDPTRIRRLGCRFTAATSPGDHLTIAASAPGASAGVDPETVEFAVRRVDGAPVLDSGFVELADRAVGHPATTR
jgi:acyl dehydratase